ALQHQPASRRHYLKPVSANVFIGHPDFCKRSSVGKNGLTRIYSEAWRGKIPPHDVAYEHWRVRSARWPPRVPAS
ncbi:MAG: hypothetical protein KH616_22540, partial [Burkholderia sp.]|nr:hypothetical protein [Burkholderia sp.]